ncbi:MAG: hypothetical protein NZ744_07240 [Pirellulaceae bacterium]|nr:hypothetical protein [Pirellulaceae bacterium]
MINLLKNHLSHVSIRIDSTSKVQQGKGHNGSSAAEEVTTIEWSIHGFLESQAILDSQVMIIEK